MVFRHISQDLKERALWLYNEGWIPEDVCEIFGISRRSLSRWRDNLEQHGSVVAPANPFQGRPRLLNGVQRDALLTMVVDNPELYLDEIQEWIALTQDVPISRTAIHTLISDAGITLKLLRKYAAERDEEAREAWRQFAREHLVAEMLVSVDETSKDGRTIFRRFGRAPKGQRATIQAEFTCGVRYSIVAALSVDHGYTGC